MTHRDQAQRIYKDIVETYQWVCDCGKQGKPLNFYRVCVASDRHLQAHERKLEWGFETRVNLFSNPVA